MTSRWYIPGVRAASRWRIPLAIPSSRPVPTRTAMAGRRVITAGMRCTPPTRCRPPVIHSLSRCELLAKSVRLPRLQARTAGPAE